MKRRSALRLWELKLEKEQTKNRKTTNSLTTLRMFFLAEASHKKVLPPTFYCSRQSREQQWHLNTLFCLWSNSFIWKMYQQWDSNVLMYIHSEGTRLKTLILEFHQRRRSDEKQAESLAISFLRGGLVGRKIEIRLNFVVLLGVIGSGVLLGKICFIGFRVKVAANTSMRAIDCCWSLMASK